MSRALPCSSAVPGRRGESGLGSLSPGQEDGAGFSSGFSGFSSGFCAGADALQKEQQFLHAAVNGSCLDGWLPAAR